MTNEEARAYATVAVTMIPLQLRQNDKLLVALLYMQIIELMDEYTETEIVAKMHKLLDGVTL